MGLFDIFTLKREATKVFSRENIEAVFTTARDNIIAQVKEKVAGEEKKKVVDNMVAGLIIKRTSGCTNGIVLWLVERIISAVPIITQFVYDFLKEKVKDLTNK